MLLNNLSNDNKRLFLDLELLLANADGKFVATEEALIKNHCLEMGLEYNPEMGDVCFDEIVDLMNTNMTNTEKKIMFVELVTVALIDGEYDEKEKKFVEQLKELFAIPSEVADEGVTLIQNLVEASKNIENFVLW